MSRLTFRWAAWSSAALSLALTPITWLLAVARAPFVEPPPDFGYWDFIVTVTLAPLLFSTFGALIVWHRPENRVGWLLVGIGLVGSLGLSAQSYAGYALLAGGGPGAALAAWLWSWSGQPLLFLLGMLPLFFPDGRLPSPRWRPAAWLASAAAALSTLGVAVTPGPLENFPDYVNPFGGNSELSAAALSVGRLVGLPVLPAVLFSIVVRLRRARGDERQQFKWFGYGSLVFIIGYAGGLILKFAFDESVARVAYAIGNLGLLAIPAGVGFAVLRYRLYDIDLLINRTVVYGATTAAIAATFFAGILALQTLLRPLTSGSELAIAASTLVSFALFQPVRRRVQEAVDWRFDRSRYDAARTLDGFADQLRDEVDLDAVRSDLLAAVRQTMLPAHASLWLRERVP